MRIFAENPNHILDDFSRDFEKGYLDTLSHRHSTTRVKANAAYQEYIADKHHIHMNATIWTTLSEFVIYLGREGKAVVDETEQGWFVQYIDRDPKVLARQAESQQQVRAELDEEERRKRIIHAQIEAAQERLREQGATGEESKVDNTLVRDPEGTGKISVGLKLNSAPSLVTQKRSKSALKSVFGEEEEDEDEDDPKPEEQQQRISPVTNASLLELHNANGPSAAKAAAMKIAASLSTSNRINYQDVPGSEFRKQIPDPPSGPPPGPASSISVGKRSTLDALMEEEQARKRARAERDQRRQQHQPHSNGGTSISAADVSSRSIHNRGGGGGGGGGGVGEERVDHHRRDAESAVDRVRSNTSGRSRDDDSVHGKKHDADVCDVRDKGRVEGDSVHGKRHDADVRDVRDKGRVEGDSVHGKRHDADVRDVRDKGRVEGDHNSRSDTKAVEGGKYDDRSKDQGRNSDKADSRQGGHSSHGNSSGDHRTEGWLHSGILVKVVSRKVASGALYKQKGRVVRVLDGGLEAEVLVQVSGEEPQLYFMKQEHLETVVPKVSFDSVHGYATINPCKYGFINHPVCLLLR